MEKWTDAHLQRFFAFSVQNGIVANPRQLSVAVRFKYVPFSCD